MGAESTDGAPGLRHKPSGQLVRLRGLESNPAGRITPADGVTGGVTTLGRTENVMLSQRLTLSM